MKTVIFLWDMAPPLVRVVAIAAPACCAAGIAVLVLGVRR